MIYEALCMRPIPNWLAVSVPCGILIYHRLSHTPPYVRIETAKERPWLTPAALLFYNFFLY